MTLRVLNRYWPYSIIDSQFFSNLDYQLLLTSDSSHYKYKVLQNNTEYINRWLRWLSQLAVLTNCFWLFHVYQTFSSYRRYKCLEKWSFAALRCERNKMYIVSHSVNNSRRSQQTLIGLGHQFIQHECFDSLSENFNIRRPQDCMEENDWLCTNTQR